ncbi:hypothetical protein CJ030_MR0G013099 [Morella rubra]|uniref:Uncharacterized protein n=1 Tax=Morella rubra TaxID=262757 RepID=A0A6A1UHS5_9ROSI|nr:hypothetical protein CJ030_MR0G013099 [Morella rubra]
MEMPLPHLAKLEELFPRNSPVLGTDANAPELGAGAGLGDPWAVGEGKNEDILAAVTYGKTAGEAKIAGSLVELGARKTAKKMTIDKVAANLVIAAMDT